MLSLVAHDLLTLLLQKESKKDAKLSNEGCNLYSGLSHILKDLVLHESKKFAFMCVENSFKTI